MATSPRTTPEDVWRLLAELTQAQQETRQLLQTHAQAAEQRFQETERLLREQAQAAEQRFQETEHFLREQAQETDRRSQELDRRFQETDRLLREQAQETDRRFQETDRKLAQISQEANQRIGKLGDRLGEFAEYQVRPAVVRLFQERNIQVREIIPNISVQDGDEGFEADLLVVNGQDAVIVEVKLKLTQSDVDEHLDRLQKFKFFMPRYSDVRLTGAVAGMIVPQNVGRYAYRQGLYVLAQSGETMRILNDGKFQPRIW